MTSLRGPDPFAIAEERLAPLLALRPAPLAAICRTLQEAVPTYTWIGLARRDGDGAHLLTQHGRPHHASPLPLDCDVLIASDVLLIVGNLATAPAFRDCFPGARALIAAPSGPGIALLVASEHLGAFGLADRALLNLVAGHLAGRDATTPTTPIAPQE